MASSTASTLCNSDSVSGTAIRNFRSQWFLIPQGTGILAVILYQVDYQFTGLSMIATVFWVLTIFLLLLFLLLYLIRVCIFPKEVVALFTSDRLETACLASIPITFTTIIQMMVLVLVGDWGKTWGLVAYVLWWINMTMALAACVIIPYVIVKYAPPGPTILMSPSAQLPIIAALTAAGGGAVVCQYGEISNGLKVPVIIVSYLLIGMALPLVLGMDIVFLGGLLANLSFQHRMLMYTQMVLSGPWSQSSFALQKLGQVILEGSFAEYNSGAFLIADAAGPVGYTSIFAGLLAWAHASFWWLFALISIIHAATERHEGRRGIQFGLSTWSLVFPWGVYTNGAIQLGKLLDSPIFRVLSATLTVMLLIIWIVNTVLTIRGTIKGTLLGLEGGWRQRPVLVATGKKQSA